MSTLAFSCASTDLVKRDRPLSDPSQPRIVQIGAVLFDKKRVEAGSMCVILRPNGWVSGAGAAKVHGISARRAELYGVRAQVALAALMDMARAAEEIVCYGEEFGTALVDIELSILRTSPPDWKRPTLRRVCAIKESAQVANAGKWMSLEDAHAALLGEGPGPLTNALDNARACARIWFAVCDKRKELAA